MGILSLLLSLTLLSSLVHGFPDGAPTSACADLAPRHHSLTASNSPSPYFLSVASKPGGNISVTIETDGKRVQGFMMQAKSVETNAPVGMFIDLPEYAQAITCTGKSDTATHTSKDEKTTVTVLWQAPSNYTGAIAFTATVLQDFSTFWTGIKSSSVTL